MKRLLPTTRFRAVLFDMDGVVVDSIPTHVQAWQEAFRAQGVDLDPEWPRLREGEKALETCRLICRRLDLDWNTERCAALVAHKREIFRSRPTPPFFPDFLPTWRELRRRGIATALVTGSTRVNVEHLLSGELLQGFDALVCSEDVTQGKPDPEPYLRGLKALGLPADECLVVENAPLGIESARAAGLAVLALTTTLREEHLEAADEIGLSHMRVLDLVRPEGEC